MVSFCPADLGIALVVSGEYGSVYNAATGRVAYTRPDATGYYRVMTMLVNGTGARALDAGSFKIPRKHQRTPA